MIGNPIRLGDVAVVSMSKRRRAVSRVGIISDINPAGGVSVKTAKMNYDGTYSPSTISRSTNEVVVIRWRDMKIEDNKVCKALKEIREEMMKK